MCICPLPLSVHRGSYFIFFRPVLVSVAGLFSISSTRCETIFKGRRNGHLLSHQLPARPTAWLPLASAKHRGVNATYISSSRQLLELERNQDATSATFSMETSASRTADCRTNVGQLRLPKFFYSHHTIEDNQRKISRSTSTR